VFAGLREGDPARVDGAPDDLPAGARRRPRALEVALVVALLAVCALQLRAILASGYSNDDVLNSQIPMEMRLTGRSFLDYWRDQTSYWQQTHGRFFPVSGLETVLVFTTFTSRAAYKAFQVVVAVAALGAFVLFVRQLTGQLWAGLLAGLVAVTGMQVRAWNDPWLQYNGQQPTTLLLVVGAMSAFLAWARSGRVRWLVVALVPWTLTLMLYETTFAFVVLFPVLVLGSARPRRARVAACLVMLAPVVVLGAYVATLRSDADQRTTSYTTDLDPTEVLPALVEQVGAALPLSYSALGPDPAVRPWARDALLPGFADLLVVAGAAAVAAVALARSGPIDRVRRWQLAGLGGALWLLPAGFVAVTVRWQQELEPGLGYVSVYLQTFGMALLAVAAVGWWRARRPAPVGRAVIAVAVVLVSLVLVVTQEGNRRAVDALQPLRWDREAFGHAIDDGLLTGVQAGDGILALTLQLWATPAFAHAHGAPPTALQFGGPPGCQPVALACLRDAGFVWAVSPEYGATEDRAQVLFAPIRDVVDSAELQRPVVLTDRLRAWVADPAARRGEAAPTLEALVRTADASGALAVRPAAPDELVVEDVGDGWVLLEVRPAAGLVDAGYLDLTVTPAGGT